MFVVGEEAIGAFPLQCCFAGCVVVVAHGFLFYADPAIIVVKCEMSQCGAAGAMAGILACG